MHDAAHLFDDTVRSPGMRDRVTPYVAYFLQKLDAIADINGTLLANSVFYYGNEFGSLMLGSAHVTKGMPVLVAGSAAGRLNPGYFIDYGTANKFGYYNNLLITFFNAMGLGSADYERRGQAGFGAYGSNTTQTTALRRAPLPFFYKGPQLG